MVAADDDDEKEEEEAVLAMKLEEELPDVRVVRIAFASTSGRSSLAESLTEMVGICMCCFVVVVDGNGCRCSAGKGFGLDFFLFLRFSNRQINFGIFSLFHFFCETQH